LGNFAGFSALAGFGAFSALTGLAGFATTFKGVLGLGLAAALGAALGAVLLAIFAGTLATGFGADLPTDLVAGFAFVTGLAAFFIAGLLTVLMAVLTADLETGLGAAFFTTGLALTTALVTAFFAVLAGAGLLSFFAGTADLALALVFTLACVLLFFNAVFELVLRGFFTSCLLAVAAYASFKDTSHLQMNCGHRLICVKTHIFDLLGASGFQLRDPVRAQIVATEQP
jgi:hypothetical protein